MDGGAWPLLVGGLLCLVNSDNERDPALLTRRCLLEPDGVGLPRKGRAGRRSKAIDPPRPCVSRWDFLEGQCVHSAGKLGAIAGLSCP